MWTKSSITSLATKYFAGDNSGHRKTIETLEQIIVYYNAGGGEDGYKDPLKKPLNLNEQEQKDLVAFLKSLSGRQAKVELPK